MKNLDLNRLGLEELSQQEKLSIEGGGFMSKKWFAVTMGTIVFGAIGFAIGGPVGAAVGAAIGGAASTNSF